MSAWDFIQNVMDNKSLSKADLKYCLMDSNKRPYRYDGKSASPNNMKDFDTLFDISIFTKNLDGYAGIGISVQANKICAIDVDHCFSKPFDIDSADSRVVDIIEMFNDKAYIEFSYSGTGMRILFKADDVPNYAEKYYIKNTKNGIEYYQPSNPSRFVSITGKAIKHFDLDDKIDLRETLMTFLNKYMLRPEKPQISQNQEKENENKTDEELKEILKFHLFTNIVFQNVWFNETHELNSGGGSQESDRDYFIIHYIYSNITKSKDKVKEIFETSPFFKSKDKKHIDKWNYNNFRYYDAIWRGL